MNSGSSFNLQFSLQIGFVITLVVRNLGGWSLNSRKIKSHTIANVIQGIRQFIPSVKQGHMSKEH